MSGDTGAHAERGQDRRQPVDREQRHGAAPRRRRGARDPGRAGRAEARRRGRHAEGRRRHRSARADGRKVTYGELAAEADLKREATGKVAPKPPGAAQDRRPVGAAPRHPGQGDRRRRLRAGPAACRAWCTAASCARRATARTLESVRRGRGQGDARRRRGGARRQLPRRRRRARGAGDQGARGARPQPPNGRPDRELPDPGTALRAPEVAAGAGHA